MMISTKGRYALRILYDLAKMEPGEFASVKDISDNQQISLKYLESITASLYRAGFVESRRGRSGGYRLAKKPSEITLYAIFEAMEGTVSAVACLDHDDIICGRSEHCVGYPLWKKMQDVIDSYLLGVTLEDLVNGNI